MTDVLNFIINDERTLTLFFEADGEDCVITMVEAAK